MSAAWLIDGVVVIGYFALILGIGLYMGQRENSLEDFALGGRRIPWWAVLASIIAAETSAGTFLGAPGEGFTLRGYYTVQLVIGTMLARIIVSYVFIAPYYKYNVYSIYEYLTRRFGPGSKNAASAVFLVTRVLASGARIYVAAIALVLLYELFEGRTLDPALPADARLMFLIYVLASLAVVFLTAIYTTLGGIKAVIWTDFIQASIMMGSALLALVILYRSIPGGWAAARGYLHPGNLFIDTGLDPARHGWDKIVGMFGVEYTIFAGLFGSTFVTMATHGTDQDMVQRMLTAPDVRRSRRSLVLSGLADLPIALVLVTVGLLLVAHYAAHPDPNLPKASNEVFCYYILHQLPVGVRGLLLAGIFATTMGSLSTALNALATSFTRDWYLPYLNPGAGERESLRAVRWATVVFAVLMVGVSAGVSYVVIQRSAHPGQSGLRIYPIILGNLRLHLRVPAGGVLRRHADAAARQRPGQLGGDGGGVRGGGGAQRPAQQPDPGVRRRALCAAQVAAGAGVPLVHPLRDSEHVPGGDLFFHAAGGGDSRPGRTASPRRPPGCRRTEETREK